MASDDNDSLRSPAALSDDGPGVGHSVLNFGDQRPDIDDVVVGELDVDAENSAEYLEPTKVVFHLFKATVGAGIFLLPNMLQTAGWLGGPLCAIAFTAAIIDCSIVLVHVRECTQRYVVSGPTYGDICGFVLGPVIKKFVEWSIIISQLGFCLVYIQTSAEIFTEVFRTTSYAAFVFMVLVATSVVFPLTLLTRNLRLLAVASIAASIMLAVVIISTLVDFSSKLGSSGSHKTVTAFGSGDFFSFTSGYFSVIAAMAIVTPIQNSMNPATRVAQYPGIVAKTTGGITIFYLVYGLLGYAAYGITLKASAVSGMSHNFGGNLLRFALATVLLLTYPIQYVPAIQVIDGHGREVPRSPADESDVIELEVDESSPEANEVADEQLPPASVSKADIPVYRDRAALRNRIVVCTIISCIALVVGGDTISLVLSFVGATAVVSVNIIVPSMIALHVPYALRFPEVPRTREFLKPLWTRGGAEIEGGAVQAGKRRWRFYCYIIVGVVLAVVGTVQTVIMAVKKKKGE